jgi:hypothetical protein
VGDQLTRHASAYAVLVALVGCLEAPARLPLRGDTGDESEAHGGPEITDDAVGDSTAKPGDDDRPAVLTGLVAHWRFDTPDSRTLVRAEHGSCTSACDAAVVGVYGAPWRTALKGSGYWEGDGTQSGVFFQLDGDDDALRVAAESDLFRDREALTIEVRLRVGPTEAMLGGVEQGAAILTVADWADSNLRTLSLSLKEGKPLFELWAPDAKRVCTEAGTDAPGGEARCATAIHAPDPLPTDDFVVLSATWEAGGATRIYVDGVIVREATSFVERVSQGGLPVWIGGAEYGLGTASVDLLAADLDYVRVYDRALTPAEVAENVAKVVALPPAPGARPTPCADATSGCASGAARDIADFPGIAACDVPDTASGWSLPGFGDSACAAGYHVCTASEFRHLTPNRLLWELRGAFWMCPDACDSGLVFADLLCHAKGCPGDGVTPVEVAVLSVDPDYADLAVGCGERWCRQLKSDPPRGVLCCVDAPACAVPR